MPYSPLFRAVGAGAVALALVAHLWMLEVPDTHAATGESVLTATVSAPGAPATMSSCPTGMSACQVPNPADPLAVLFTAALAGVAVVALSHGVDRTEPAAGSMAGDRGPPRRLSVPSSVVLLV